jgi:hypothetical protein
VWARMHCSHGWGIASHENEHATATFDQKLAAVRLFETAVLQRRRGEYLYGPLRSKVREGIQNLLGERGHALLAGSAEVHQGAKTVNESLEFKPEMMNRFLISNGGRPRSRIK